MMERERATLRRKTYVMHTWDHRADPGPQIAHLFGPFGIDPPLGTLDADFPERLLKALARKHRLYLYDVPSLEGSDAYGFILSREKLNAREIQQIEADYWGEPFDEVYPSQ